MTFMKQLEICTWLDIMEMMLHFLVVLVVLWFCLGEEKNPYLLEIPTEIFME